MEAVDASKITLDRISRPAYLAACATNGIIGWTKEQIQRYPSGWTQLKKDAMRDTDRNKAVTSPFIANPVEPNDEDLVELDADIPDGKKDILLEYSKFVKKFHYVPKFRVFKKWCKGGVDRDIYTNIQDIDDDYRYHFPEEARENLCDIKSWTPEYRDEFFEEVRKHDKFIITSIGSFCTVDFNFLESLKNYAELNNAMIIGLPLFKGYDKAASDFCVHPEIQKYLWIAFEDITLNTNLMIQVLKSNCTTKSTLVGLDQLVARYDSSIIVAGINQQLKYIPVLKEKTPNLIASTGWCTGYEPVKKDDQHNIPTRAEKLAKERLSIKGALVVELYSEDTFAVRNIEAEEGTGYFIDLGTRYMGREGVMDIDGSTYVIGDLHAPNHNEELLNANIRAIEEYNCNTVVLHDSVNMAYVSHHNAEKAIVKAQMVEEGKANIITEIETFVDILDQLSNVPSVEKIIIPYSNHPSHLEQFVQDIGRMSKDLLNLRTSLQVALAMLDRKNVLQYLTEEKVGYQNDKIDWVNEDDGREIFGVQVGLHGSEKVNGGRLTTTSTNKAFPKTVLAHSHSAGIDGDTITVGIACDKEQGYNHGLSSWTESSAIVYPNGKVQLLTFVNVRGEYKLWL